MSAALATIYRHPIKAIGRETLSEVLLEAGKPLSWDRSFAVAHKRSREADLTRTWAPKANFLRGVTGPELMAVECTFNPSNMQITLTHPRAGKFAGNLNRAEDERALLEWLDPLWPKDAPRPTHLVHHEGAAQTDVPDPWLALNSSTAHRMVAEKLNRADLSIHRWRGNLWIDGLGPWEEFEWIGKSVRIGEAVLKVEQRITRCKATMANPETGRRDADTLGALENGWGHTDFGVYAEVTQTGMIRPGDSVEVI